MSEFAGELRVKIVPDTTGFQSDLQQRMNGMSPRVQAMLQRTGLAKSLQETDDAGKRLAMTQDQLARKTEVLATANQRTQASSLRTVAGFTVLGIAARQLTMDFGKWAETQGEVVKGLGQIATGVSNLDLVTTGKGIGNALAGLNLRGENQATSEAQGAVARVNQRENAVALAKQLLDLREQTAKAEGTVGTAAGRTRFELEKQLKITQAAYNALAPNLKRVAGGQFNLNPDLSNKRAVAPTDASRASDFQLSALRAGATKTSADDAKILEERRKFLAGQVRYLEKAGADTQAAKDRLTTLYGQLDAVEGQLEATREEARAKQQERIRRQLDAAQLDIQIQQANARGESQETAAIRAGASLAQKAAGDKRLDVATRQQYELQAAQANKQLYEIQVQAAERAKQAAEQARQERLKEIEAEKQRYREGLSLQEQRLQVRVEAAQLTGKNLKDDRAAIKAEIAFYKAEQKDRKLSVQERLTARSNEISARLQLKGLSSNDGGGGQSAALTSQSFFAAAANQFNTYGSNTAGKGGVLSGQDARAKYASRVLSSNGAQSFAAAVERARAVQANQQLAEAQRQTALLHTIAAGVRKYGVPGPVAASIGKARGKAFAIGGH